MLAVMKVLYDPLCGWCYGATPSVRRLVVEAGLHLALIPTGLFSGDGARPIDAGFAEYAWANDQRIARLTGQRFSERYRDDVLGARGVPTIVVGEASSPRVIPSERLYGPFDSLLHDLRVNPGELQ